MTLKTINFNPRKRRQRKKLYDLLQIEDHIKELNEKIQVQQEELQKEIEALRAKEKELEKHVVDKAK